MSGRLSRRSDPTDLNIPSITTLGGPAGRALQREGQIAVAKEHIRVRVQETRLDNAATLAGMAVLAIGRVRQAAEAQAANFPEFRAEVDGVVTVLSMGSVKLLSEYIQ